MRIEFTVGKDQRRIAKRIVRRLPAGQVRIGEPARLEDSNGQLIGWAIEHPELDGIDAIRLRYVMDTMADGDPIFTDAYYDADDITAADIKALKDRIDADPTVSAALRAHREARRPALAIGP